MQYIKFVSSVIVICSIVVSSMPVASYASDTVPVATGGAMVATGEISPPELSGGKTTVVPNEGQLIPEMTPTADIEISETNAGIVAMDTPSVVQQVVAPLVESTIPSAADMLIVSEVKLRGTVCDSSGKCSETKDGSFVELYNPSTSPIVLNNWRVQYFTQSATTFTIPTTELAVLNNVTIAAQGYAVVGINVQTAEDAPVISMATVGIGSKSDGYIRVVGGDGRQTDLVGWGKASAGGARTFTPPPANSSTQRCEQVGGGISDTTIFAEYDKTTPGEGVMCQVVEPPVVVEANNCTGLQLSEISANNEQQFIELYNAGDQPLQIGGCQLQTNRSLTKTYVFSDEILAPQSYKAFSIPDTGLTLTKTTSGTVYLLSSSGSIEIDSRTYSGLAEQTSWSRFGDEWRQTFVVTPGGPNLYEAYLPCDEGYERNFSTGRCNKLATVSALTDCGENKYRSEETGRCRNIPTESIVAACKLGQYRSEETNRCRNIVSASALKPCREDQYRSEETNRCRNIVTASTNLKPCKDNQYRSEETNRCRNMSASAVPAAAYAVQPVKDSVKTFVGWWALGGIALLAVGYAAWEWRKEVAIWIRNVIGFLGLKK